MVVDNKSVGIFNNLNTVSKSINLEYMNNNNKKQPFSNKILKKQSNDPVSSKTTIMK